MSACGVRKKIIQELFMVRKVVIGNCTLLKGNCEEVMEGLESNSINAVASDPPYLYLKHKIAASCKKFPA